MISRVRLVGSLVILLLVFSILLPSPSISCETSVKTKEASLVCLLPDNSNGKVKPVMALVTKDGEFYPIVGSEDSTQNLTIIKKNRETISPKLHRIQNAWPIVF